MSKKLKITAFIFSALLLLSSCSGVDYKERTKQLVKEYFECIKAKDYDKALSYYSSDFFHTTPKSEWVKSLKTIANKLGDLRSYELESFDMQKYYGRGTHFILQYKIKYSKYSAEEIITFEKPAGFGRIAILSHTVISPGF